MNAVLIDQLTLPLVAEDCGEKLYPLVTVCAWKLSPECQREWVKMVACVNLGKVSHGMCYACNSLMREQMLEHSADLLRKAEKLHREVCGQ